MLIQLKLRLVWIFNILFALLVHTNALMKRVSADAIFFSLSLSLVVWSL